MSLTRQSILAPQPATTRASPSHLSVDPKGGRIAYASGRSVFLRSIDDPSLSTQYTGHTAAVTVARFSPSGYYVASGDASGKVRVWDCVGEEMATKGEFAIISGPIKDLAWDGESKRIIAVGDGKERFGHCITFDTGNSVGEITGQSSAINSVSIRQQRPFRAATASDDQTLVFYNGAPFKFNKLLNGHHSNYVQGVAFSPDGAHFVSVGTDRKIFLFDGKDGTFQAEILDANAHHKGSILSVSWAPDSTRFVTASVDQTVKLWDATSRSLVKTWSFGPGSSVPDHQVGVVWTLRKDGLIISLSLSGDLNYLLPDSPAPIRIVSGHQKPITALDVSSANTIFTGSTDGRVCSWDLATGTASVVTGKGHTNVVCGFARAVGENTVASVGWDDNLRLISGGVFTSALAIGAQPKGIAKLQSGELVVLTMTELQIYSPTFTLVTSRPLPFSPTALAAASTGHIAVAGADKTIRVFLYTPSSSSLTPTETQITLTRSAASVLAYSPDGTYLAAGDAGGLILLFRGTEKVTDRWAFHTARVVDIAWNPKGDHVATASLDTGVFVYSVQKPMKNVKVRNAHMGGANAVRWVGGEEVVSAGFDGTVKRWGVVVPA